MIKVEIQRISHSERRSLGRFDTPRPLAQALTDCVLTSASDTVLEPSCGGGVFVRSAIARLSELGSGTAAQNVWACDIDERALSEAQSYVAPHAPNFVRANFLTLSPTDFKNVTFSVIVGNPPFVRLHALDTRNRTIARNCLLPEDDLNAKASLWAYFPIHAYKMLAPGGKMGWILPEIVLHAEYGKQFLLWATKRFKRCLAVSIRERCFTADGAKERVVLLVLEGAGSPAPAGIELLEYATAAQAIEALRQLDKYSVSKLPQLNGHAVPHLVSPSASAAAESLENLPELKQLGEFATLKIGVVTGDNKFFLMTDAERVAARLKRRHFKPAIAKFVELGKGFNFSQKKTATPMKWLLCPNPKSQDRVLLTLLNSYDTKRIDDNRTMEKRAHWQVPLIGKTPDAFFRYMGKEGPRMVLNQSSYYCSNTIHCAYFKRGTRQTVKRAICLAVHSSYCQLSAEFEGRQYGSGVLKLEPSEAKRVRLPFNKALVEALATAWPAMTKDAAKNGWHSLVPQIDALVVENCPGLARGLPLSKVLALLEQLRQRRNSQRILIGS